MRHTEGRWLVGIVGLVVVVIGLVLVSQGARRKFMKYPRTAQMSHRTRRVVELLGWSAPSPAAWSGGIDKALLTLRNQPAGEFLMLMAPLAWPSSASTGCARPAGAGSEGPSMADVAVVAHSGKSFGGGLPVLRAVLAREGVTYPLWYEVRKSRHAPACARRELRIKAHPGAVTICVPVQAAAASAVAAGGELA